MDTHAGLAKFSGTVLGFTRDATVTRADLRDVRAVDDKTLLIAHATGSWRVLLQSAADVIKARDAFALMRKSLHELPTPAAPAGAANELFVAYAQQRSHTSDDLLLLPGERVLITERKGSLVFVETLDREGVSENGWCHADTFAMGPMQFFGTFEMDKLLESAQEFKLEPGHELRINGDLFVVLDGQLDVRVGNFVASCERITMRGVSRLTFVRAQITRTPYAARRRSCWAACRWCPSARQNRARR